MIIWCFKGKNTGLRLSLALALSWLRGTSKRSLLAVTWYSLPQRARSGDQTVRHTSFGHRWLLHHFRFLLTSQTVRWSVNVNHPQVDLIWFFLKSHSRPWKNPCVQRKSTLWNSIFHRKSPQIALRQNPSNDRCSSSSCTLADSFSHLIALIYRKCCRKTWCFMVKTHENPWFPVSICPSTNPIMFLADQITTWPANHSGEVFRVQDSLKLNLRCLLRRHPPAYPCCGCFHVFASSAMPVEQCSKSLSHSIESWSDYRDSPIGWLW